MTPGLRSAGAKHMLYGNRDCDGFGNAIANIGKHRDILTAFIMIAAAMPVLAATGFSL